MYDHHKDPLEWDNLASKPELKDVKQRLAKWLPRVNAEDAPREQRQQPQRKKRAEKALTK